MNKLIHESIICLFISEPAAFVLVDQDDIGIGLEEIVAVSRFTPIELD